MLVWIEVLAWLGAVTAGYLLCRAVRSRPILSLTSTKLSGAVLRMVNPTNDNILIREVIFQPEVYALALRGPAYLVGRIAPHAVAELPFVVSDRTLEAEIKSPVRISDDHETDDMVVYDIGGGKVGQPVKIELSRDGARASFKGKTTTDKHGFVFAEAKNFPVRPLISVLAGEGPVKMFTGKTMTILPDEGRAAELAEFAARCSPD